MKIFIYRTSNLEKTGKLILKDNKNKTILKADIAIGSDYKEKTISGFLKEYEFDAPSQMNEIFGKTYLSTGDLNNRLFLVADKSELFIARYKSAITIDENSFKKLSAICNKFTNLPIVEDKKKWFMFGQKDTVLIDLNIKDYIAAIRKTKLDNKIESFDKKSSRKDNKNNSIKSVFIPKSSPSIKSHHSLKSMSVNKEDDIFDIMYMTAFPELAPIYRPNSALAWILFFNDEDKFEKLKNDSSYIKQIPGFEKHNGGEFVGGGASGNWEDGYIIKLESKNQLNDTTITFHHEKGLMIKDENGNQTLITKMNGKDGYTIAIESENSSTAYMEMIPNKEDSFIGNWSIEPNNAIAMSSSFQMNNMLTMTSNPDTTIDLQGMSFNSMNLPADPVQSYYIGTNSGANNNLTVENSFDYKEEPPPPPPPPRDDFTYESSDPYNSSSMSP